MHAARSLALRVALAAVAFPCGTFAAGFLSDPVVTHTNGMRLASTTAERSHNVYWRCDTNHLGYCDGCLYSPCRNDWRSLGTRPAGEFGVPCTPRGAVNGEIPHAHDGLEPGTSELLGLLAPEPAAGAARAGAPVGSTGTADGATQAVAAPAPAAGATAGADSGGLWIDAIQTIGRKMMATPPADP